MHDARSKRMYCRPRQTCMHEQDDPGRTRTCNPRLRRPMPYPLGHGANDRRDLNSPTLTDSQQACACVPACLRARARVTTSLSQRAATDTHAVRNGCPRMALATRACRDDALSLDHHSLPSRASRIAGHAPSPPSPRTRPTNATRAPRSRTRLEDMQAAAQNSGAWFRSTDLWVMSPTR